MKYEASEAPFWKYANHLPIYQILYVKPGIVVKTTATNEFFCNLSPFSPEIARTIFLYSRQFIVLSLSIRHFFYFCKLFIFVYPRKVYKDALLQTKMDRSKWTVLPSSQNQSVPKFIFIYLGKCLVFSYKEIKMGFVWRVFMW